MSDKRVNGLSPDELRAAIERFRANPELAKFKFRASHAWIDGAHGRTTIKSFFGAEQEDTTRTAAFELEVDEPNILFGQNLAPNATETLLHGLASCLGGAFVFYASARGVAIDSLRLALEGDVDLRGFLGISDEVRPGLQNVRVVFEVESSAPRGQIEELVQLAQRYSPVFDSVSHGLPVTVRLAGQKPAPVEREPPPMQP